MALTKKILFTSLVATSIIFTAVNTLETRTVQAAPFESTQLNNPDMRTEVLKKVNTLNVTYNEAFMKKVENYLNSKKCMGADSSTSRECLSQGVQLIKELKTARQKFVEQLKSNLNKQEFYVYLIFSREKQEEFHKLWCDRIKAWLPNDDETDKLFLARQENMDLVDLLETYYKQYT